MRIDDALGQVRLIQLQVQRVERYCCYRWVTVAGSGVMALGAAALQPAWVADPARHPGRYVAWWILVAAASVLLIGTEIFLRWLRTDSELTRRQTTAAVKQFFPCIAVGALITLVLHWRSPDHAALYPGLWSALFSLGIFASLRQLPSGGLALAVYYLLSGLVCLGWGQGASGLQPWTMAITFGAGQLFAALLLYRQQEEADGCS